MRNDWALAYFAYPVSRFIFPALTFGRVRVAAWEDRAHMPWAVRRTSRTQIELGPDLAGLLACGLIAMEAFSLINAIALLQTWQPA